MSEPHLRAELSKIEPEPPTAHPEKADWRSLVIGLAFLIILAVANHFLSAAT